MGHSTLSKTKKPKPDAYSSSSNGPSWQTARQVKQSKSKDSHVRKRVVEMPYSVEQSDDYRGREMPFIVGQVCYIYASC